MSDKLRMEWFWTDRWTGSRGFLLPAEARGVYREMLTQAWRRGAALPADEATILRATGISPDEWARNWKLVEGFWRREGDTVVNDTQIEIYRAAKPSSSRRKDSPS